MPLKTRYENVLVTKSPPGSEPGDRLPPIHLPHIHADPAVLCARLVREACRPDSCRHVKFHNTRIYLNIVYNEAQVVECLKLQCTVLLHAVAANWGQVSLTPSPSLLLCALP